MGFTPQQYLALEWIARGSATLSFFGILAIFGFFIFNPQSARNPTARLIIFMAVGDGLSAFAKFLGRWPLNNGPDGAICQAQAAIMQEGDLSSLTWTAILAYNLLLVVFFKGRTDTVRRNEIPLAIFAFGWPLIFAIVPLFITGSAGKIYGDSNIWCWVKSDYPAYSIGMFYAVLWCVFLFNIVAYILVGRVIWNSHKDLTISTARVNPTLSRYRLAFARTALVYITAFLIVWTPSNLNRFYALATGSPLFIFSLLQTIMSPMRGFVNFLAYFWIYKTQQASKNGSEQSQSRSTGYKSSRPGGINRSGDTIYSPNSMSPMTDMPPYSIFDVDHHQRLPDIPMADATPSWDVRPTSPPPAAQGGRY
ncbi:hypothetical protein HKX48_004161 [Thoreauomyces humboldtii]|nr:hypothetical protein HKX48_004161 [Thoreauomyces humboldtii]